MTAKSERFEMRVDEDILGRVDKWRSRQQDVPSRAESMRRLIEVGLARNSTDTISFSDGEKLLFMMLRDLFKHFKISQSDTDIEFVSDVIYGGHYWAPILAMPGLFHNHEDDPREVRFVMNVLDMWDSLERGFESLSRKEKERVANDAAPAGKHVRFLGFDGNNEATYMGIAGFLVEKMGRFARFKDRNFNAHMPSLDMHRRMLAAYEPKRATLMGGDLSSSQIIEILKAGLHPNR